jgi:hypothetical protein
MAFPAITNRNLKLAPYQGQAAIWQREKELRSALERTAHVHRER